MLAQICFSLTVLMVTTPFWGQEYAPHSAVDELMMRTPPPVSNAAYPVAIGSDVRSNYLHAGVGFSTAYDDNVLAGIGTQPVGDVSYSIFPTISFDQTTPRLHQTLMYSPGFTFYQRTGERNEEDQAFGWDLQYRLSPHIKMTLEDNFRKSSNVFNQSGVFMNGSVSGSAQSPFVSVIAPIADQLSNNANTELTYQFARNSMVGGSGTFNNLHYPKPSEVSGLSNSDTRGGSVFYSQRMSLNQYIGATYQYSFNSSALPNVPSLMQLAVNSETQTHGLLLFYTVYLGPSVSFSVSGGPQHYNVSQSSYPDISAWKPAISASMGWQAQRVSVAGSYSRIVSGGGGLVGAYHADNANGTVQWALARNWLLGSGINYANMENVNRSVSQTYPGGNLISGTVKLSHFVSTRLSMDLTYVYLHQSYNNIPVVAIAPNTNRVVMSISYRFTRPLGR